VTKNVLKTLFYDDFFDQKETSEEILNVGEDCSRRIVSQISDCEISRDEVTKNVLKTLFYDDFFDQKETSGRDLKCTGKGYSRRIVST